MAEQIQYIISQISNNCIFLKEQIEYLIETIPKVRPELGQFEYCDNDIYSINLYAKNINSNQNLVLSIYEKYRRNNKNKDQLVYIKKLIKNKKGNIIKGQNQVLFFDYQQCFEIEQYLIQETDYSEFRKQMKIYRLEEIKDNTKDFIRILDINKSDCKIRDQKALGIASTIGQCQNLSSLKIDLGLNEIGDAGAGEFIQQLKNCSKLNKLYLSFSFQMSKYGPYMMEIQAQGAMGLGQGLQKLQSLQCLTLLLDKHNLNNGAIGLFKGIGECKNLINLNLSLNQCNIEQGGIYQLSESIIQCKNISQLSLSLKNNSFRSEPALHLVRNLRNCQNLFYTSLILTFYNQMNISKMAEVLFKKCNQLVSYYMQIQ